MLVVLEGLDGAGKSTQLKNINRYLLSKGYKVKIQHFPIYETPVSGDMVSRFLRGDFGPISAVHPMLVALLFAENRRDAVGVINNWLNDEYVVLLDRYVYSNIAFQCAKLNDDREIGELRDWILETEFKHFSLPKPDVNFFLDVPVGFVHGKLKEGRQGAGREYLEGKKDIHEADIEFQKRVREIYLGLCEEDASFVRIDCGDDNGNMLPPEAISEKLRLQLNGIL